MGKEWHAGQVPAAAGMNCVSAQQVACLEKVQAGGSAKAKHQLRDGIRLAAPSGGQPLPHVVDIVTPLQAGPCQP